MSTAPAFETVEFNTQGQEVLVVEDNVAIRETFQLLLEEEGYRVVTAGNGKEALELIAERGNPAAIFLDLNMPEMDGVTFLQERLRAGLAVDTPVIVFTAMGKKMRLRGVSEWVKKPIEIESLLSLVSKYCNPYVLH